MFFKGELTDLTDGAKKIKIETPPVMLEENEKNIYKKFIFDYYNNIDTLLLFLMYGFANIEGLKEHYEKSI